MKKITAAALLGLSLALAGCASIENSVTKLAVSAERSWSNLETKQVVVGDFTVPYLEGGRGETIFLIHGFQSNKDIWIRFARELTSRYNVIAIDLPAHGESNILMDRSYSFTEQARRVIAIMDQLQLTKPVHLMGHSMGGAIAYHVAALAPARVKSLGLMSSGGVPSPQPSEFFKLTQKGENPLIVRNDADYKNMLAFTMSDPPYLPSPLVATFTREAIARESIATKIFHEIIDPQQALNPELALPQIKLPTFVIWGDQDRVLDVSSTSVFKRLMPQSQVVILKNVGHAPQLERTKETAQAYTAFLATVKP